MTGLPTGTVTFLFADIEGSTSLLKKLGQDRYEELLTEHARIIREAVATHGGNVVDTQGDSFFAAFRAARDGALAAAAIQRALAAEAWPGGVDVRVRMGLHSGEPKASAERYVGIGVHRAARVGNTAHGGQVVLSDASRVLVEDDLPEGMSLRDLGAYRLKDIDRPERIWQLEADGLVRDFPPLSGAEMVESQSPRQRPLRRRSLLAAALAGVIAAAVAIPVFALGQGSGSPSVGNKALIQIDTAKATVAGGIAVSGQPTAVTTCVASVFVASRNGFVYEIDPNTSHLVPIFLGGRPGDMVHIGGLATVLTGPPEASVTVIDSNTATPGTPIALPGHQVAPAAITVYGVDIWIADPGSHRLERIGSPYTGVARQSFAMPPLAAGGRTGYAGMAADVGDGSMWVAGNTANKTLWKIDMATGRVSTIPLSFVPAAVAADGDAVWVVDRRGNAIVRVDPRTGRLGSRIQVGRDPVAIAVGASGVWVANRLDGTVDRVDPTNGAVKPISIGGRPVGLTLGLGSLWVIREPA